MKKVLVFLVVLSVTLSLFASGATEDGGYKGVTNTPFATSLPDDSDSLSHKLHVSPASLADNKLIIQLPSIALDGYNVAKTISKPSVAEAVSNMMKFKFSKEDIVRFAVGIIENVGSGYNSIVSSTVEAGAAINHFAFGVDAVVVAKSMPAFKPGTEEIPSGDDGPQGIAKTGVVPMFDLALTAAYGTRVLDMGSMFLNAGVAVRYVRRSYITQLSASRVIDEGLDLANSGARGGFAVPFDLDVDFGILNGDIKLSLSANNLNGYFYMAKYANFVDGLAETDGTDPYKVYTPWSLNLGVEISHDWSFIAPKLTIGFEDILGYFNQIHEDDAQMKKGKEIFRYLTFRADIRLVRFIKLNAAFSHGYLSFGGALDFSGNSIELSYGYHEAGYYYGMKPVDTLTLRIKLGFDKN